MSGLQTIIDKATSIAFDRRKMVGIQYTRSEIPKVSETPTRNPWRINITFDAALAYNDNRDLLEALDYLDRRYPSTITFSNNPNLSWICKYKGDMTTDGQKNGITIQSFVGNQLTLTNLPATGSFPATSYLFRAGDFIQIGNYPYPFTVVNDVLRTNNSTITLTTHRPNFLSNSVVGQGLLYGNQVNFNVFCPNMPTYSLVAGASQQISNTITNNAYIQFSSDFQLFEWTGAA